ncbi:MAG: DoxX family protein [Anaerolineae bacterium]
MDVALWVVQGLLALAFLMAGTMKVMRPKEKLAEKMGWVEDFSAGQVKIIGALEALGAIGLILPAATGILPWLTPTAAVGLALVMIGAALTYWRRGEYQMIAINLVLLLLAAFVAYGRFVLAPLT